MLANADSELFLIRRRELLDSAIKIAKEKGYKSVTRNAVSKGAGMANGLLNYWYESIDSLRSDVMEHAIANCKTDKTMLLIISQGIFEENPTALSAPKSIKTKALRHYSDLQS